MWSHLLSNLLSNGVSNGLLLIVIAIALVTAFIGYALREDYDEVTSLIGKILVTVSEWSFLFLIVRFVKWVWFLG